MEFNCAYKRALINKQTNSGDSCFAKCQRSVVKKINLSNFKKIACMDQLLNTKNSYYGMSTKKLQNVHVPKRKTSGFNAYI